MKRRLIIICSVAAATLSSFGCRIQHKVAAIREEDMNVMLSLPSDMQIQMREIDTMKRESPDTIVLNFEGHDMLIMKAIKDEKTGEMIANEELKAAVITARFRNIAERHGRVDIEFEILVPDRIQDTDWQLRFRPEMYILEDTTYLDKVYVTGPDYRYLQLRGYQQYERFLSRIITDTTRFINLRDLEIFLQRNIPQVYKFRNDTSFVSDEEFASYCGVSEREAIDHYTSQNMIRANDRRKARQGEMYARYVKSPIETENIRIDTVQVPGSGDLIYRYIQTINTRPGLRKVEVVVDGDIWQQNQMVYDLPLTEPLTFYISSLATFVDPTTRYVSEVRYRRAEASAAWNIDFHVNRSDIDMELGDNSRQMQNIRDNIDMLLANESFDLDSVTITAFASPEGSLMSNNAISQRRGAEVAQYFDRYVAHVADSIERAAGILITVGDDMSESSMEKSSTVPSISFKVRSGGENWCLLDALVDEDTVITAAQKEEYVQMRGGIASLDECEKRMQTRPYYAYMKNALYPQLRAVQFRFALHRKGMVKDTVHTTVVDTVYMNGVQAIRDRDYEGAVALLGPYKDFNTAIAYTALDRNASAMEILKDLKKTPQVKYMLALLYSREGNDALAVKNYVEACREDGLFVHRGNLDPEISALIKKYGLNEEDDLNDFQY